MEGSISDNEMLILHGNSQGKLPSPANYLTYLSDLALTATTGFGYYVYLGSICITIAMCTYDMLILGARPEGLLATILFVECKQVADRPDQHTSGGYVFVFNAVVCEKLSIKSF